MRRFGLIAFAATALTLVSAAEAPAGQVHHCGNPPGWSGKLTAFDVGCDKARSVFKHVRCSDRQCTTTHSGRWQCYHQSVSRYAVSGNCHLGHKQIRWFVVE